MEQPLVTELSVVVLQQEVVPPLFEGRACCETDAGCVFYDGGAGGGENSSDLALMALGLEGGGAVFLPSGGGTPA